MELEPEIRVLGLECNRTLPENVLFLNNMVIEEPEYGIFFIDIFVHQAFQRMNDMHKVDIETLLTYLVIASNVTTPENTRLEEMSEDLKYVQSLEKYVDDLKMEIDDFKSQLEIEKTEFPKVNDLLFQVFFSKDLFCAIQFSIDNIEEYSEMKCNCLEKIKECE
ncbi:hypothetical protein Tco_0743635, partial [Tanacetum coccineum]